MRKAKQRDSERASNGNPDPKGQGTSANQLSKSHYHMLHVESGLSDEVITQRGYRTVTVKADLKKLGFSENQTRVPALLIPLLTVHGEVGLYHIRPDEPRIVNGKPHKYEFPKGSTMVLDVPLISRSKLDDPSTPLLITEGAKKGDALASLGCAVVSLIGVWNWRGTNGLGGKAALADWELIPLNERLVYIVFDSDVMVKPAVYQALERLKAFLESRHAHIRLVYLPSEDGRKVGVDDYLVTGKSINDLVDLATTELKQPPRQDREVDLPYCATDHGLIWVKRTDQESVPVPLTNFTAQIVSDLTEDDGAATRRFFEIEACLKHQTRRFTISANQFAGMHWVAEHLGAQAILYPGPAIRDRARVAIQMLSSNIASRQVYSHTGWRKIDNQWMFLHEGGAVGPDGPVQGIEVFLPQALKGYRLPDLPEVQDLGPAIRASLNFLFLAPFPITFPLLAATYRAVLGEVDFSLHMSGPTGAGKSELAALVQQHYGPQLDARHLPGSWSSTSNSLEVLAFHTKDCLFVVDDFAPSGSPTDVQRAHREADRLLRAQGNKAGRQRLRPDATVMPTRFPRGLILSTGEDVPKGHSIRSRMMIVEVGSQDLDWKELTLQQKTASQGLPAQALSGFLRWLAPQYETIRQSLPKKIVRLREQATQSSPHRRTPEITANLGVGLMYFLDYAVDMRAITPEGGDEFWEEGWDALGQAAEHQSHHHAASEPTARFIEILQAAVASGQAHFASCDGGVPRNQSEDQSLDFPSICGWRYEHEDWRPQGERVGWVEPSFLYLQPDSSYKAVQKFGQGMSDGLSLTPRTLRKRLKDKGLLILDDSRHDHLTIRKVIEGQRREVLCLSLSSFISLSPQPDQLNQKNTGNDKKLSLNGPDGPVLTRGRINRTPRARRQSRLF